MVGWPYGFHLLAVSIPLRVVVIPQLPRDRETSGCACWRRERPTRRLPSFAVRVGARADHPSNGGYRRSRSPLAFARPPAIVWTKSVRKSSGRNTVGRTVSDSAMKHPLCPTAVLIAGLCAAFPVRGQDDTESATVIGRSSGAWRVSGTGRCRMRIHVVRVERDDLRHAEDVLPIRADQTVEARISCYLVSLHQLRSRSYSHRFRLRRIEPRRPHDPPFEAGIIGGALPGEGAQAPRHRSTPARGQDR